MKKSILIVTVLSCGLVMSNVSRAAIIHLLQNDLQMNSSVYWPDEIYQNSYSGPAFVTPGGTVLTETEESRVDSDGNVDEQWAAAWVNTSVDSNYLEGWLNASDNFSGNYSNIYDAEGDASIDLGLTFLVHGDGATINLSAWWSGYAPRGSFSFFDVTLDTLIGSGDGNLDSLDLFANLADEHVYTLNVSAGIAAADDPDNVGFQVSFGNAHVVPVPSPGTLALLSLGIAGLLVTRGATSRKLVLAGL